MASSVATPLEQQFGQIPGVTQMTSSSALGFTSVTVQFDLSRNVDSAAADVLAAIKPPAASLPPNMPYPPTIRKVNPADTPILVLALTSDTLPLTTVDAYAENILLPKISQISGVGLVGIGGQQKPAIRVQVDPQALAARGIGLEDVRTVLGQANVDLPKGTLNSPRQTYTLNTNDQLLKPDAYDDLIVAYATARRCASAISARRSTAPENDLLAGWCNKQRAIILAIQRQPGANVIETVDRIKALLPQLQASIPPAIKVIDPLRPHPDHPRLGQRRAVHAAADGRAGRDGDLSVPAQFLGDRHSRGHRAAVADRHVRRALCARLQPRQSVADGVVDRGRFRGRRCRRRDREHRAPSRRGATPMEAALKGAGEIGFTIISITLSLIAVFIPLFLMGGYVGKLFQEFAVTVSVSLVLSLVISLTLTPMMCARLLQAEDAAKHGRLYRLFERGFDGLLGGYERGLKVVLRHRFITLMVMLGTIGADRLSLCGHPQRLFPAAGHRNDRRHRRGRAGHLFPGDGQAACRRSSVPAEGSGGRFGRLADRRRAARRHAQPGPHVHRPEAERPAQRQRRPGDRAAASSSSPRSQGITLYMQAAQDITIGARVSQDAVSVHADRRGCRTSSITGRRSSSTS